LGAKFSTPIAIGLHLVLGRTAAAAFTSANVSDPRVRSIAAKVTVRVNPARDLNYPGERSARVTVRTRDGSFRHEVVFPKGEPEFPLTDAELQAKFEANATLVYPLEHARRVADTITSIENRRVRELTALLAAPRRHPG
jgi:2-methylcitrate dehydratase PrpD